MKQQILVPNMVYKFMEPKYLKKIQDDKKIFINFLGNYSTDKYGNAIGDDDEGKLNISVEINNHILGDGNESDLDHYMNNFFTKGDPNEKLQITGGTFLTQNFDNNFYNYCVALEYREEIRKEFGGAVMVIRNFPKFIEELNKKLKKRKIGFVSAEQCEYVVNREKIYTQNNFRYENPATIKESKYEYQQEYRLLWKPFSGIKITKPIEVYCPKALEYCTFHF
ncbi:hypothetical protein [Bacillus aerius]|uniref:hypothetical protein n=1 Tax=Bacillus aerius TaxID=293388 RepID=UPI00247DD67B|nr:hypothetical protein [Bacillus aerius]MDH6596485.1 hypothetical protein [Bacillus aerius]